MNAIDIEGLSTTYIQQSDGTYEAIEADDGDDATYYVNTSMDEDGNVNQDVDKVTPFYSQNQSSSSVQHSTQSYNINGSVTNSGFSNGFSSSALAQMAAGNAVDMNNLIINAGLNLKLISNDLGIVAKNTAMASTSIGLTSLAIEAASGGFSTPVSAAGLTVSGLGLAAAGSLGTASLSTGLLGDAALGNYGSMVQQTAGYLIGLGVGSSFGKSASDKLIATPVKNIAKGVFNAATR